MKKKIILPFIATLVFPVFSAQASNLKHSQIPPAVFASMKAVYPGAKDIKVDKELHFGLLPYEVKYTLKG